MAQRLSLSETTTNTPSIPRFVKSQDELKLSTIYMYFLTPDFNFGPYARAEAAAPVFKGEDVRAESKTYRIDRLDGPDTLYTGTSLRLTDGFRPLTSKEALGLFYRPIYSQTMRLELRVGLAAQQIQASGQFAVKGTNPAGEIKVDELQSVRQGGLEAGVSLKGKIDDRTGYELGLETLTPFINDKAGSDSRDAWKLTNVDGFAKLTSKLTSWAAFGYDYRLKIQPQLVDRAQQIHMMVLNITYPAAPGKL
ncbi:MAG: hypothetical protein HC902_07525 [Calothrix sp. SM1_5_4]|nr:hypothetical protein [Calothrix sp. SM1_5_4]